MPRTPLDRPLEVNGRTVLEDGSPAVWFTFPGEWHDIGRFHLSDGTFTGIYANILTPVELLDETTWRTTDLFLDLWLPRDGEPGILDEDELAEAEAARTIDAELAERARTEVERLRRLALAHDWPPAIVGEWPLERVVAEAGRRHS
jgi:predicted RNA-binding protein associated with RNAse of E/G family